VEIKHITHVQTVLNLSPTNEPIKQHRFYRISTADVAHCTIHISYLPAYKTKNFFPSSASEESVGHFTITHMLHDILYLGKYNNHVHI